MLNNSPCDGLHAHMRVVCTHACVALQVLMVEPPLNERAQRQEMAGMMFETFKVFAKQNTFLSANDWT